MSLNAPDGYASYDNTSQEQVDISPVMNSILLADTFFLGAIGKGEDGVQRTKYWKKDSLNASVIAQASGAALDLAGAVATIAVSAADGALISVGALLKDIAANSEEVLQVTANTGTSLTVTRGYGSSDPELHAATPTFRIISQPKQENDKDVTDRSKLRVDEFNRFQIFKETVEISNTTEALDHIGVPSELSYQIANRTLECTRTLGMAAYHGIRSAEGSDSIYRSLGGVREFTVNGGNVRSVQESLDENVMNTLYRMLYDQGAGESTTAWGSADQITKFSNLFEDKVRLMPSDRQRGLFVNVFLTNMGQEVPLKIDRWIQQSELLLAHMDSVKLHALRGRNWQMKPLSVVGDGQRAMLVGEFTISVRQSAERFALHKRLSV
jgi:hypothetical protein